jgi:tetratricopeptide (TPR) repeat protein
MNARQKKATRIVAIVLGSIAVLILLVIGAMQSRNLQRERMEQMKTIEKSEKERESWIRMIDGADETLKMKTISDYRATAYLQKAYAHAQLREWEKMHENIRLAQEADAVIYSQGSHLYLTAFVLAENGMYKEAVPLFEDTLKSRHKQKGDAYARFLAFTKNEKFRNEKRAIELFRANIDDESNSYVVHESLSKIYANTDRWKEALEHAELARDGAIRSHDAMLKRLQDRVDKARERGFPMERDEESLNRLVAGRPKLEEKWDNFVKNCEERQKPGYSQKY